jgi:hypothetical protein
MLKIEALAAKNGKGFDFPDCGVKGDHPPCGVQGQSPWPPEA